MPAALESTRKLLIERTIPRRAMSVGHYENFPVASLVLPARFRRPVALIYRFAREADDFADEGDAPQAARLADLDRFRRQLRLIEAGARPEIDWFSELAQVVGEYRLPLSPFEDLLSAFSQDVVKTRYADYDEVLDYCGRSANPVGRLLIALYGAGGGDAQTWSDAICTSLQLINFLQDVAIDFAKGRIYLPQDEMKRFGIAEAHIACGDSGPRWQDFMRFQVERARALLFSGAPLGRRLQGRLGLELRLIVAGGARILDKIERARFDVFRYRPVLRPLDWPRMLLHAW